MYYLADVEQTAAPLARDTSVETREHLGSVRCPSGKLLILDGGLAGLWSVDRGRDDRALSQGAGAAIIPCRAGPFAIRAIAVDRVPADRALPISGEQMLESAWLGNWRRVWIDMRHGTTTSTRALGRVPVDTARLMAIDAEAIEAWNDEIAADGLADVVFWGRDAALVANEVGAEKFLAGGDRGCFGWLDLVVDAAAELAERIDAFRSRHIGLAVDFRPHTHQWRVMRTVRAAQTGYGEMELAGSQLCMFETTWGDGHFPVTSELDSAGQMLRLCIDLGFDAEVTRSDGT